MQKKIVSKTPEGAIRLSLSAGHLPHLLGAEVRKEGLDVEVIAARAGAVACYEPEHDWYTFVVAN